MNAMDFTSLKQTQKQFNAMWHIVPQKGTGLREDYPLVAELSLSENIDPHILRQEYLEYWTPIIAKDRFAQQDISKTPFFIRYKGSDNYHDELEQTVFPKTQEGGFITERFRQYQLAKKRPGTPGNELWHWTQLKKELSGTYLEKVLALFRAPIIRPRFSIAKPGCNPGFHIDFDNPGSYAFRVHIPVITAPECQMIFKQEHEMFRFHLSAGKAYFTNISYSHNIENHGDLNRVHLVIDLMSDYDLSDEDIKSLN